jgi:hypothetical protein
LRHEGRRSAKLSLRNLAVTTARSRKPQDGYIFIPGLVTGIFMRLLSWQWVMCIAVSEILPPDDCWLEICTKSKQHGLRHSFGSNDADRLTHVCMRKKICCKANTSSTMLARFKVLCCDGKLMEFWTYIYIRKEHIDVDYVLPLLFLDEVCLLYEEE